MVFKTVADIHELLIHFGHRVLEVVDRLGGTDARDDVLALRVHQELAHQFLFARRGVAREGDAGAGGRPHVAEDHALHVDGGAPVAGNVVDASVIDRSFVVPGAEDRLDRAHQLLLRIGREVASGLALVLRLEEFSELLEILRIKFGVEFDALFFLDLGDQRFKIALADLHNDVGIHLDEASVAVPRPAGVARLLCDGLHDLLVEPEVKDRVHHAGHGRARARADRDEQRIHVVSEFFAGDLFKFRKVFFDLIHDLGSDRFVVLVILDAGFAGNGEALGNGHTEPGHFGKVGAFAA